MARKNLMIVMAGNASTHLPYFAPEREYDLWVNYFGDDETLAANYAQNCDRFWRYKGMKIELVRKICLEELYLNGFDFSIYNAIFLCDDDIIFENGATQINQFFEYGNAAGADSFQPSIKNEHYSYKQTITNNDCFARAVNWVEMMMPAYSSQMFINGILPAIHYFDYLKSGWGIELASQRMAEFHFKRGLKNLVFDAIAVIHSRPTGQNKKLKTAGELEIFMNPMARMMERMMELKQYASYDDLIAQKSVQMSPRPIDLHIKNYVVEKYLKIYKLTKSFINTRKKPKF